jgi:hypothetical protein
MKTSLRILVLATILMSSFSGSIAAPLYADPPLLDLDSGTAQGSGPLVLARAARHPPAKQSASPPVNEQTKFNCSADTMVAQGYPDENLGELDYMGAGNDTYFEPDGLILRSLIYCDLSGLPDRQQITAAALQLYHVTDYAAVGTGMTIRAHRGLEAWSETTVTWNNQPQVGEFYGSAFVVYEDSQVHDFDITDLAQAWYAGDHPNHGIVLRGTETFNAGWRGFGTREDPEPKYRPALVVEYEPLPPPLQIAGITPDHGMPGETVKVVIEGVSFDAPQTYIERNQRPLDVTIVLTSTTHITGTLDLPGDAALGAWDVWVRNADGQFDTLSGGFTVQDASPGSTIYLPAVFNQY